MTSPAKSKSERREFGFDFGERGFQRFAADGIGSALIEDAFTLEFESLTRAKPRTVSVLISCRRRR